MSRVHRSRDQLGVREEKGRRGRLGCAGGRFRHNGRVSRRSALLGKSSRVVRLLAAGAVALAFLAGAAACGGSSGGSDGAPEATEPASATPAATDILVLTIEETAAETTSTPAPETTAIPTAAGDANRATNETVTTGPPGSTGSGTPVAPGATSMPVAEATATAVAVPTAEATATAVPTAAATATVVPAPTAPAATATPAPMPTVAPPPGPEVGVDVGDLAPAFALRSLAGPEVSLASFRGEGPVAVVFYRAFW